MILTIKKRLQAIEQAKANVNVPDVVIIFWDESEGHWIAKEQYTRKNTKGKVIPYSGKVKLIPLESPEDYKPPEGFSGTIMIEGEIE